MSPLQLTLLSIWMIILIILIISVCLSLLIPKAFVYVSKPISKQGVRSKLIVGPTKAYRAQIKVCLISTTLFLIIIWAGFFALLNRHFILTLYSCALASALYIFPGIVTPYYEYLYWSQPGKLDFEVLPHKIFNKLLILRLIRAVCLVLLSLLPAVFHFDFLMILLHILNTIVG